MPRPRTTVYIATSTDGFIARPDGSLDWLDHDSGGEDYGYSEFIASVDVLLMGRNTFQTVLGFGEWPYGEQRVVVLSSSLGMHDVPQAYRPHVEITDLPPAAVLAHLGTLGVEHVYVDGGRVIQACLREGLVDELILTRIPVLLGSGIPLFGPLEGDVRLTHIRTRSFDSGLVQSHYFVEGPG